MRFIDATEIDARLDYPSLVAALEADHRAEPGQAERLTLAQSAGDGETDHFLCLPAWQGGAALGAKLVTSFPGNGAAGLPTVHGIYVLFEGRNGRVQALIDGTAMTPWKTAADSALGAKLLAREDAETLVMVGAGVMAPHLIRAHLAVRPGIRRVAVWNRNPARAEALARDLVLDGVALEAASNLEVAVRAADVISCATAATAPLVRGAWLKPGAHLDLVGGFTAEMREADDEALRQARVHVDSRWFTLGTCGDLTQAIASGALTEDDVLGDLYQLCSGEVPGRTGPGDITLFKNGGGGHLDLMTARYIAAAPA